MSRAIHIAFSATTKSTGYMPHTLHCLMYVTEVKCTYISVINVHMKFWDHLHINLAHGLAFGMRN